MALQIVDIYTPSNLKPFDIPDEEIDIIEQWVVNLADERVLVRILLATEHTEPLLDALHGLISGHEGCRIVVSNVEVTLPRLEEKSDTQEEPEKEKKVAPRISREELYQDIDSGLRVDRLHYTLVVLSTIVAAVGMLRNNVAVVIGAMVIAPLIGPNLALALSTTLGDTDLLKRATKINLAGISLALVLSILAGILITFDPTVPEIASRSEVNLADIGLALAAGVAGALSVTRGVSSGLIGVMVAVALLPPLVAVGLFIGAGHWMLAYRGALLLMTNIGAINLASIVTFLLLGIRPHLWHEEEQARNSTRVAITLWVLLLGLLTLAIFLADPIAQ